MKSFFYGLIGGMLIILGINFFWETTSNWTLSNLKAWYGGKTEAPKDTISDETINIKIAEGLQKSYGTDSLIITSIGLPQTTYEYYVCGVKGTKPLEKDTYRAKKVIFTCKGSECRIFAIYDATNGDLIKVEEDNSPRPQQVTVPQPPNNNNNSQPSDTAKQNSQNNKDVGYQNTYNNASDV